MSVCLRVWLLSSLSLSRFVYMIRTRYLYNFIWILSSFPTSVLVLGWRW